MSDLKHTKRMGVAESSDEDLVILTLDWEKADPESYRGSGTDSFTLNRAQAKHLWNKLGNSLKHISEEDDAE